MEHSSFDIKPLLDSLRQSFNQLVAQLPESSSKAAVIRQLREAKDEEVAELVTACNTVEIEIRNAAQADFDASRAEIDQLTAQFTKRLKEFEQIHSLEDARRLQAEMDSFILQIDQGSAEQKRQYAEVQAKIREKFLQAVATIVNRFHDRGRQIMLSGVVADDASKYLDPGGATRH